MLDQIFNSVISGEITFSAFIICTAVSLVLGAMTAFTFMFKNRLTKTFAMTLALLPVIVQVVIMMVNGNIGAGVAVAGAFGLIRFRSVPGDAKEIFGVFLATATGIATGMGYAALAAVFTVIVLGMSILYTAVNFGGIKNSVKELRITIPEGLEYNGLFDDLFKSYTNSNELIRVKTTNMGSLYQLQYVVEIKDESKEKEFLDEIRCRNGNLDITFGRLSSSRDEL